MYLTKYHFHNIKNYLYSKPVKGLQGCGMVYRFAFNGKELDKGDEGMGGGGSTYDYGFRIYNAQLGKFLSVDPLTKSYPWYTPYQFGGNMPIAAIDMDGLEEFVVIRWWDGDKFKGTTVTYLPNEGTVRRYNTPYQNVLTVNRNYNLAEVDKIRKGDIFTTTSGSEPKTSGLQLDVIRILFTNPVSQQRFSSTIRNKSEVNQSEISQNTYNTFKKSVGSLTRDEGRTVNFEFDKTDPLKINPEIIQNYTQYALNNPDFEIKITGYTDAKGSEESNFKLGLARANEAKAQFVAPNVNQERIKTYTAGECQAVMPETATNQERQVDRKVEINWQPNRNLNP